MLEDVLGDSEERMKKAVEVLRGDLATIRTGRASPALIERIKVDYYDTPTPLNQLAAISVPDPRLLVVRPYDPSSLAEIERAILKSELGLNPLNDGKVIRLAIPRLTEERRQELVKVVSRRVEEARVAIRNCRRDGLQDLKEIEKEKLLSEDDYFRGREEMQKLTDQYIAQVDEVGKAKEREILEI
jgi:ribosome recycling factor